MLIHMEELLLAIVDFGRSKRFFVVRPSDVSSFVEHHSKKVLGVDAIIVFQNALVYDPQLFHQDELNKLKSIDYGNN